MAIHHEKNQTDFPTKLSAPALRTLLAAKILGLKQLAEHSEREVLALHGMGRDSLPVLRRALADQGLAFRREGSQ